MRRSHCRGCRDGQLRRCAGSASCRLAYEAGSLEVAYRPARTPAGEADPASEGRSDYTPPRTPAEAALAEIFAEVLSQPRVGVQDDFFALGGDSLRATRVMARIHRQLERELPLQALFETPTVAGLAECLAAAAVFRSAADVAAG